MSEEDFEPKITLYRCPYCGALLEYQVPNTFIPRTVHEHGEAMYQMVVVAEYPISYAG